MIYYGRYAGADLQQVCRTNTPDDRKSGESLQLGGAKVGQYVANPDILTTAQFSGEWDRITKAEADAWAATL